MNKILLLSPEFGLEKGGIQTWVYYINKLLKEEKYIVKSYGLREIGLLGFISIMKHNFINDTFILMTWKMIIAIIPAFVLSYFFKKRIFIFIHGNDILNLNPIYKSFIKILIKNKNIYFIANSNAIADVFFQTFKYKVDYVIYPFIKINENLIENKKDKNIFFTVTRLVKRKNIENVIKALKLLKEENFTFQYLIAGDGEEKQKLEKLTKELELEKYIRFLGKISEEEKEKILQKSSLFLLPSVYDIDDGSIEGYGIVYIEANAYGIPVIAGNTGGIKEAVIDGITGIYTDGTVDNIKNAIKKYYNIKFDKNTIIEHAKKHDYKNQKRFLKIIEGKI